MSRAIITALAAIVVFWSGLALFGQEIIALVLPDGYHDAWGLLLIFSIGYVARYFWTINIATAQHAGRNAELPWASLAALAVTLALGTAGMAWAGMAGPALAFAAGHIVLAYATRRIAARAGAVFERGPRATMFTLIGLGVLASLAAWALQDYPAPVAIVAKSGAMVALLAGALVVLRRGRKV